MSRTKTGLLGGTFNPVHRGHIELGLKIKDAFHLDSVLYILSARPPHKKRQELPPAELRLAMLEAALQPHPGLLPCDLELRRQGYSWTIDTINELKAASPRSSFYFITGSEGFLKIRTWKEYRRILRAVLFIIVLRRPSHRLQVERLLREEGVSLLRAMDDPGLPPGAFLHAYVSDYLELSATAIRKRLAHGQDVSPYVERDVQKIMEEIKLYEEG
ncbi:MAG: nicotinate (nicotinamide) nucleotide adenylyltransferase [Acidobacteria bacterium]|jgi:nicotinate-nucleotide adenylyltransferase|nr:nicotinate (nicotinamide) nucleotide adenylyltransferase [Acidobacteriota bacterium]